MTTWPFLVSVAAGIENSVVRRGRLEIVTVERWEAVKDAVDVHRRGFDFADALHWACSGNYERFVTFDDRKMVRRAQRLGLKPVIALPR